MPYSLSDITQFCAVARACRASNSWTSGMFENGTLFAGVSDFRIASNVSGERFVADICLDHDQVSRLFRDHRDAIVHLLVQRVRCPDTAQDLSQEAYLRLLRREALPHADNLAGYLYRTAERLAIDFLRYDRRVNAPAMPLDEQLECPRLQPEPQSILRQQCERLLQTIASLPDGCRQVLLLRKIDELSYSEIAARLAISEKTVQRHLVKAMLHCQRRLNADED